MADDGGPGVRGPDDAAPVGRDRLATPEVPAPRPHAPSWGRRPVRRRLVLITAVAVAVAAVAAAVVVQIARRPGDQPAATARSYLTAWNGRDYGAMARLVDQPPPTFAAVHQRAVTDLDLSGWQFQLGSVTTRATTADATFTAHFVLAGLGRWDFTNTLHLGRTAGGWMVEWNPAAIFPTLPAGGHFSVEWSWAPRAAVLGTNGAVLAASTSSVTVGLQGSAITNPALITTTLAQAGLNPAATSAALRSAEAHPDQFVAVADLPDDRYQQIKSLIFSVPGTRFRTHTGQMTLTPDLAAHVVGSVGPITAEELTQLGPPYQATALVGHGGIEAQYDRRLAGTPGGQVKVIAADGTVAGTAFSLAPKAGSPVQTTIDSRIERAAEGALKGVGQPASVVAVRASTGEVLAAVSHPVSAPFDRALTGRYPPGSTFKVITSAALLAKGLTPDSLASCPKSLTVAGKTFRNFEGEAAPSITLQRAFAVSCNTAFIGLAGGLTAQMLVAEAGRFGFGTTPQPGLPVFGGQVPEPADEVGKVATAIGQDQVLASPLQMAGVAAAVDSGAFHAPRLVIGAPDDTVPPMVLEPAVVGGLRSMMAAVVMGGTGTAANVGGGLPVYGKTGTAEFGSARPPMTHAWFIGFQGDVAFAVVVEGGGVGGAVAAPIAAKFLRALQAA